MRRSYTTFRRLVPDSVWAKIRGARRVFVVGHRGLHELPFEALVTEVANGRGVPWLENGPPIAYVPSASLLHWLRRRRDGGEATPGTGSVLVVGDPVATDLVLAVAAALT